MLSYIESRSHNNFIKGLNDDDRLDAREKNQKNLSDFATTMQNFRRCRLNGWLYATLPLR